MKKNLNITKTRYSKQIVPVPWPLLYLGSTVNMLTLTVTMESNWADLECRLRCKSLIPSCL